MVRRKPLQLFFLALFCFSFVVPAFAVLNLVVTPNDGGYDLKFGRVGASDFKVIKQLTVRVTSDTGHPYRVIQRIERPLQTSEGVSLSTEQFKMYPLAGSNSMGALLYREESVPEAFDTILYTSSATGESDSFQLVYSVTPLPGQSPGFYSGRISFILIPVQTNESQVVVGVNVSVELAAGAEPVVEVKAKASSGRIEIDSRRMADEQGGSLSEPPQVTVSVANPVGARYRIYQLVEDGSVVSSAGDEMPLETVRCDLAGNSQGTLVPSGSLSKAVFRQLLYTSDPRGGPDSFTVTYVPEKAFMLSKAGLYRGRLSYLMETDASAAPVTLKTFDLAFDVASKFDIRVTSNGKEGVNLDFGDGTAKSGPRTSVVDVEVISNLGKPYRVLQKVFEPMRNEEGVVVAPDDFTVKAEGVGSSEPPRRVLDKDVPVKEGETEVYASGASGESGQVHLIYTFRTRPDTRAGRYDTRLGYSLALD